MNYNFYHWYNYYIKGGFSTIQWIATFTTDIIIILRVGLVQYNELQLLPLL